jgi:Putative zinc-finger
VKHLGIRVSALVDDQLSHDERDRALAHVTRCEQCRLEMERERETKAALRRLPPVEPPAELVKALLALAETGGPLPPQRRPFPGPATPAVGWRPIVGRPRTGRPVSGPGSRRPEVAPRGRPARVQLAAGSALSLGVLTLLLATLGGPATSGPASTAVVPPIKTFTVEHAKSTDALPFVEPASYLVPAAVVGEGP